MRIRLLVALLVLCLPAFLGSAALGSAAAQAQSGCTALRVPATLGKTLLALHRDYMRHRPDVHDPKISGPVGPVHLGECAGERYAVASFDARYNGYYFGVTDQPERFDKPPGDRWRDIGNTGGEPCGSMPTALLVAWKLVPACPA